MEIEMETTTAQMEMTTNRQLRCTWQRTSDMYATLMLMPGITVEYLQSMIDTERVFVDDGGSGEDGYLYTVGGGRTYSELVLARIVKLEGDCTDDPGSFVLSEETDNPSPSRVNQESGTLTEPLPNENSMASQVEQRLKVVSEIMDRLKPIEDAMFRAGDAVDTYVSGRPFPTNNHLERAVWATQLRGVIARDEFRDVCDNLRRGWSAVGDC
jgi:hypothetical protein